MKESFEIWIDRLKEGIPEKINESFDPSFLDLKEAELELKSPVRVVGEAYVSDQELILRLSASTQIKMPCAICNQMTPVSILAKDFYHAQPLNEIPSGIFDYQLPLREALLIEFPPYVECNQGECPERTLLAPYLRNKKKGDDSTHFPFSNIDS